MVWVGLCKVHVGCSGTGWWVRVPTEEGVFREAQTQSGWFDAAIEQVPIERLSRARRSSD